MRALIVLLALGVAAPAAAAWRRVDSPNFVVVGDASARDLRGIATKFELFNETLKRVLGAATTSAPVPTVVIVFPDNEAFAPFKPVFAGKTRNVAGYAASGPDVNYIAMLNVGEFNDRLIFHEYTHLVVANAVTTVPAWLNEGLAEFYSTFALTDGGKRAQIGRPILQDLQLLNGAVKVPLADLLRVDVKSPLYNEQDTSTAFYAESWALVHMLINAEPSRVPELGEYLRRVSDGASETQAWEQIFGTARTENDLRRYLARPIFNTVIFNFPGKLAALPLTDAQLSPADAAAFLGALQLRRAGADAAAKLLEPALKQDPANALANAVMGQIEVARRDPQSGAKRLMAIGRPGDWFTKYRIALSIADAVDLERDMTADVVSRVTELLDEVRVTHTELANVLAALAKIEMYGDATPSAAARERIARARALAPGRVDYALTEAQLFAEARDFARARAVIGPLMTPVYPEDVRNAARRLMAGLVDLEKAVSGAAAVPTGASRSVAVPDGDAGRPRASAGQGRFVPSYRALQPGEQRLDGALERIDCGVVGKPAVFHVRTAAGIVDLEGQLADVDLLSYRDDLTGGVSCGEREPMRVYVTWREGASSRHEKVVVAVEFLPKD